jgi:hypothetical protein
MVQVRLKTSVYTPTKENRVVIAQVVRVRETQEFDVEVATTGDSREAAKLARRNFLGMTP